MRWLIMSRLIRIYTACHSILICDWDPYLEQWFWLHSKLRETTSETQGWTGLAKYDTISPIKLTLLIPTSIMKILIYDRLLARLFRSLNRNLGVLKSMPLILMYFQITRKCSSYQDLRQIFILFWLEPQPLPPPPPPPPTAPFMISPNIQPW